MQAFKSNKEGEAWNSPGVSELLVPTGVIVNKTGTERNHQHQREVGGFRKVVHGVGFSQKLWIVLLVAVLTALTASQALQWVKIKEGERCPHLLNDYPPPTTKKGASPKLGFPGEFKKATRMPSSVYMNLLEMVRPYITYKRTPFRKPVTAEERLSLTIRYLSRGDSTATLAHGYLVAKPTVLPIVKDTCKAIFRVLEEEHMKVLGASHSDGTSEHESVQRHKREIPEQLYISLDQYLEGQAGLRTEMRQLANHPAARFALRGYISAHEIDTPTSFQWQSVGEQSMFTLSPPQIGRDLQVQTTGYYHLSLSVMFNGRASWSQNSSPACSLKVAAKTNIASTNQNDHRPLLYLSRSQVGNGHRIRSNSWPIDTAQASGIFLLHRGDVIYVRPGTFSLGCRIYTRSYKTHLDAFLISRVTA